MKHELGHCLLAALDPRAPCPDCAESWAVCLNTGECNRKSKGVATALVVTASGRSLSQKNLSLIAKKFTDTLGGGVDADVGKRLVQDMRLMDYRRTTSGVMIYRGPGSLELKDEDARFLLLDEGGLEYLNSPIKGAFSMDEMLRLFKQPSESPSAKAHRMNTPTPLSEASGDEEEEDSEEGDPEGADAKHRGKRESSGSAKTAAKREPSLQATNRAGGAGAGAERQGSTSSETKCQVLELELKIARMEIQLMKAKSESAQAATVTPPAAVVPLPMYRTETEAGRPEGHLDGADPTLLGKLMPSDQGKPVLSLISQALGHRHTTTTTSIVVHSKKKKEASKLGKKTVAIAPAVSPSHLKNVRDLDSFIRVLQSHLTDLELRTRLMCSDERPHELTQLHRLVDCFDEQIHLLDSERRLSLDHIQYLVATLDQQWNACLHMCLRFLGGGVSWVPSTRYCAKIVKASEMDAPELTVAGKLLPCPDFNRSECANHGARNGKDRCLLAHSCSRVLTEGNYCGQAHAESAHPPQVI